MIQDFAGFLKVLNPALSSTEHVLVLLYECGAAGATYGQLDSWARPKMRSNLRRTLRSLVDDLAFLRTADGLYYITATGQREVEVRLRLHELLKNLPDHYAVTDTLDYLLGALYGLRLAVDLGFVDGRGPAHPTYRPFLTEYGEMVARRT